MKKVSTDQRVCNPRLRSFANRYYLFIVSIALCLSLVPISKILAQEGGSCQNSIPIELDNGYSEFNLDMDENQSLYVEFEAIGPIAYFDVKTDGEYPQSAHLFMKDCKNEAAYSEELKVDSNNVAYLTFAFADLKKGASYSLRFDQNSTSSVEDFTLEAITYQENLEKSLQCGLLTNGSFEETVPGQSLYNLDENIHYSVGWGIPTRVTQFRADLYHNNSFNSMYNLPNTHLGNNHAVHGLNGTDAYAGMYSVYTSNNSTVYGEFREWTYKQLESPLIGGHKYLVTYYVSLSDISGHDYAARPPGIKFTETSDVHLFYPNDIIALTADIEHDEIISNSGWVKVQGIYTAQGAEEFITIANFRSDIESLPPPQADQFNRSYFFVDEVSIVDLDECCVEEAMTIPDGWNVSMLASSPTFAPYISGNTLDVAAKITVAGDFFINSNFNIRNADFIMEPNSSIEVLNSSELSLEGNVFYVCSEQMWNGITIENEYSKVTANNVHIRDAKKGINSLNGGAFIVDDAVFDGNYYGIYVDAYDGIHQSSVKGSVFKATEMMLSPHSGRAYAGIYLNEVVNTNNGQSIIIGSDAAEEDQNLFEGPGAPFGGPRPGLRYGIYSHYSAAEIYNNTFKKFIAIDYIDPLSKHAIYAEGPPTQHYYSVFYEPELIIGGSGLKKNYIENSNFGVYVEKVQAVSILNNEFNMSGHVASIYLGVTSAVFLYDIHSESTIEVSDNDIYNIESGVRALNFNRTVNLLKVNNNRIELNGGENNTGIYMSEVVANTECNENVILDATRGIEVIDNPLYTNFFDIKNNYISINTTIYSGVPNYGIYLADASNYANVVNNSIYANTITTNTKVHGISANLGFRYGEALCNQIQRTGTALHFAGIPQGHNVELFANSMNNNENCLVLTDNTILGDLGSLSQPVDISWGTNNTGYHTYTDNADGNQTTLFTRGGGLPYEPTNNGSLNPLDEANVNTSASGSFFNCEDLQMLSMPEQSIASEEKLIDFEREFSSDTLSWLAQYSYYRALPADSLILSKSIQQFKDSVKQSALGKLLLLDAKSNEITLSQLADELQSINPQNIQESRLKTVIDYKLTALLADWDSLASSVANELEGIASACPFEEGPAVYKARVLLSRYLGKQYYNNCEGYTTTSQASVRLKNNGELEVQAKLYPNPAQDAVFVELDMEEGEQVLVELYDLEGRLVQSESLNETFNKIKLDGMSQGVYFYRIWQNDKLIKTDKLIIQ